MDVNVTSGGLDLQKVTADVMQGSAQDHFCGVPDQEARPQLCWTIRQTQGKQGWPTGEGKVCTF